MSSSSVSKLTTAKAVISTVGSIAATVMVARSIAKDYLPHEIQDYLFLGIQNFFKHFSSQLTIVIDEFDELTNNEIYDAAAVYLGTKISPYSRRLKAMKHEKENSITLAVERNEEVSDIHNGAKFKWVWVCHQVQQASNPYNTHDSRSSFRSEVRCFQLMFHKKHKELALNSYLPFILKEATAMQQASKTLKIFTFDATIIYSDPHRSWKSVSLDHPATFDTLAMEPDTKEMVLQDLEMFVKRRDKYRRIGKAWKRGYLLYGPPGTGKSSLIAAIANYLKFDIYDLELTDLRHNSDLRRLLIATANRSILVVEDIDCTIELQERVTDAQTVHHRGFNHQEESKVTLSGFLNFIDGLWSSCGDERIIIFTTNHKEKLDPALLRPGRMDMHIHMSYCTPCGFRLLAANYLGIDNHELFGEIEEMIRTIEVTPAEVAEQLLKSDEPDASLNRLMSFLHGKRKENEEAKAKELVDEESVGKGKENKQDNEIKE